MPNKIHKPKYFHIIILMLLISITLSACPSIPPAEHIIDTTWRWTEVVETEPASQSIVPNPEKYTLLLSSDGTVSMLADCNMVSGSSIFDDYDLTIELGPSTMAYCGEESLDLLYLGFISSVESFNVVDGRLVLDLKGGAGRMTFTRE